MKVVPFLRLIQFTYSPFEYVALRSEWAKAWARTRRWAEEVVLIKEEIRRVLQYHEHRALWWEERRDGGVAISSSHAEGIAAYAHDQANLHRKMAAHCIEVWGGIEEREGMASGLVPGNDDQDEERELAREEAPSDEEVEMAEGDNQEEGWEGIEDDNIIM